MKICAASELVESVSEPIGRLAGELSEKIRRTGVTEIIRMTCRCVCYVITAGKNNLGAL